MVYSKSIKTELDIDLKAPLISVDAAVEVRDWEQK